jgi:hypothetical protein
MRFPEEIYEVCVFFPPVAELVSPLVYPVSAKSASRLPQIPVGHDIVSLEHRPCLRTARALNEPVFTVLFSPGVAVVYPPDGRGAGQGHKLHFGDFHAHEPSELLPSSFRPIVPWAWLPGFEAGLRTRCARQRTEL